MAQAIKYEILLMMAIFCTARHRHFLQLLINIPPYLGKRCPISNRVIYYLVLINVYEKKSKHRYRQLEDESSDFS